MVRGEVNADPPGGRACGAIAEQSAQAAGIIFGTGDRAIGKRLTGDHANEGYHSRIGKSNVVDEA
jgi:hypothetical protein